MGQTIQRPDIADYIGIESEEETTFAFMGTGFTSLDENPNAQNKETIYICDKAASNSINSYKPVFPFNADTIKEEAAVMELYEIGRNEKTGAEAERDYIRVELFKPVKDSANTFAARKFRVSVEVSSFAGGGGENLTVSGNLNAVGNFIDGTFNTTTRTFTVKTEGA